VGPSERTLHFFGGGAVPASCEGSGLPCSRIISYYYYYSYSYNQGYHYYYVPAWIKGCTLFCRTTAGILVFGVACTDCPSLLFGLFQNRRVDIRIRPPERPEGLSPPRRIEIVSFSSSFTWPTLRRQSFGPLAACSTSVAGYLRCRAKAVICSRRFLSQTAAPSYVALEVCGSSYVSGTEIGTCSGNTRPC